MTREELERAIAERLGKAMSITFGDEEFKWHPAWIAVAREAMAMMERVAFARAVLCLTVRDDPDADGPGLLDYTPALDLPAEEKP